MRWRLVLVDANTEKDRTLLELPEIQVW